MHDGTVRKIHGVHYVMRLKNNLFSDGQFDDLGYKIRSNLVTMKP